MPELPEVETVRRGLAPVMEGARFVAVEARRRTCAGRSRRTSPSGWKAQTVTVLGRRAKYLLADLSSGEVLLMHLGMSGSFRVAKDDGDNDAGRFPPSARDGARARPCRLSHVVGRAHHLQRPAPVRLDDAGAARRARRPSADARIGPEPLGNAFDAAMLARACRQEGGPEGGAARPDRRRRARQHLCLRGAAPRRLSRRNASPPPIADQGGRAERARGRAGRCHQGGAGRRDRGRRLVACAITARPTASSAISSIISASTTARASPASRPAATARSSASSRPDARHSFARRVRSDA